MNDHFGFVYLTGIMISIYITNFFFSLYLTEICQLKKNLCDRFGIKNIRGIVHDLKRKINGDQDKLMF